MQKIPSNAQAKFIRLAEQEQQAQLLASAIVRQIGELDRAIGNLENSASSGDRLQALRRERAFHQNTLSTHQQRHRELGGLNTNIRNYLERLPPEVDISESKPVKLKVKDGEDYLEAVARIRADVLGLISERSRIQRADITRDEKKAKLKEWIARQQERAGLFIRWENGRPIVKFSANIEGAHTAVPDVAAMMAWLHPKAMETRLLAMLDASPEPGFTISTEDREQRLKELGRELLILERQEEAIISAAAEKQQTISRRPNADPRAVLGLTIRGMWKVPKAA